MLKYSLAIGVMLMTIPAFAMDEPEFKCEWAKIGDMAREECQSMSKTADGRNREMLEQCVRQYYGIYGENNWDGQTVLCRKSLFGRTNGF